MTPTDDLYSTDAYLRTFEATVVAVDPQKGIALDRSVFYPGGGGQPHDTGELSWDGGGGQVTAVGRSGPVIWHRLAAQDEAAWPEVNTSVEGTLDWERRHLLMRTHTALHVLCGVIWQDYRVAVTGGNMGPGSGRLDFELDAMSGELGQAVERRINYEIEQARQINVEFAARADADQDEALIRTKAHLIPASIDPLRIIDIVGLDRQADGGTHVASTAEVGVVSVTKTESKGRANKRIRLKIGDRLEV